MQDYLRCVTIQLAVLESQYTMVLLKIAVPKMADQFLMIVTVQSYSVQVYTYMDE